MRHKLCHSKKPIKGSMHMFDKESNELLVKLKVITALWIVSITIGLMVIFDSPC